MGYPEENSAQQRIRELQEEIRLLKVKNKKLKEINSIQNKQEKDFWMIFDTINESICIIEMIFDADGRPVDYRILRTNREFKKQNDLHDADGELVSKLVPGVEPYWFELFGKVVVTGEAIRYINEAGGLKRWYDVCAFKLGGQDSKKIAVFAYDITGPKQKEEEMEKNRRKLSTEVEGLKILHSLSAQFIGPDELYNRYDEILEAAIKLTQADKGHITLCDKQTGVLNIIRHRGFPERTLRHFNQIASGRLAPGNAIKTSKRVIVEDVSQSPIFLGTHELPFILEEGIHSVQSTPMISSNGNNVGALTTHYTEFHRFEEFELRMLDMLARQVADVIERANAEEAIRRSERHALVLVDELRKMDENKNKFLSVLSHELRNPLASITMSLSLQDRVPHEGELYRQARDVLQRQTTQLTRLVDDLLEVTRITQNKVNLKKEWINLKELLIKAIADFEGQFAAKGVGLESELPSDALYLEADQTRLTQVIGNLLHNSAKFTKRGGFAKVALWKDEMMQEAVVVVRDNGIGIEPNLLPDLFTPFMQADSSLDRSNGGLGLGLAIVRGMVELHKGSVTVSSEGIGKGTQFFVRLPLHIENENKDIESPHSDKAIKNLKILVIEDIADVAEILCALLRLLGHEVVSASTGAEGIEKINSFLPNVILSDIGLPDMSGYEVARMIRSDSGLRNIRLIAVSGYAQQQDIERAIDAGFDRHLAKPIDIAVLKKMLGEMCKSRR